MNLELLLKQARQAAGDVKLDEADTSEIQLRAVEAIECGIADDNWTAVAEGLALAHEVLARLAERAPASPMRSREEIDRARQILGGPLTTIDILLGPQSPREDCLMGAYAALSWVLRHSPTDAAFVWFLNFAAGLNRAAGGDNSRDT